MGATTNTTGPYWPDNNNPFHAGELAIQEKYGVHDSVMSWAPFFVRPFMADDHREFFESQPFLVVAARDEQGHMWSTLLFDDNDNNKKGFVTSPDPTKLLIQARPLPGDALEHALQPGSDLGIIGIEFATKRRNRVNGRLIHNHEQDSEGHLLFEVNQSFGNCPQYIKPRQWWWRRRNGASGAMSTPATRSNELSREQINKLKRAETIFIATGYRGEDNDPRYGNDISHRGGPPGFVRVPNKGTILIPDFAGNNVFNTIGNLVMDPAVGVTFPQYGTGSMIQVTGIAKVHFDGREAAKLYPGAKRIIEVSIEQVVELPEGSMPIQWAEYDDEDSKRKLQVVRKVKESDDVTSFYLRPSESGSKLWKFRAGQHLPIQIQLDNCEENDGDEDDQTRSSCEELQRTYSLSSSPDWDGYRISVKRETMGVASRFLHDKVKVGDTITVYKPAGDFVYDSQSDRTLVLISAGVGITPVLSMLHQYVQQLGKRGRSNAPRAFWIHGARDGKLHPFRDEVNELKKVAGGKLVTHVAYSQPDVNDSGYDSKGRINLSLLQQVVPDLQNAEIYMCGTGAFMANMENGLVQAGVGPSHIHFETF
jgi:ferredoxin-NADP reductase/predicted pyridoxine 5'-phosphate oxidase superfamily flavin-nucleotide-binding protein